MQDEFETKLWTDGFVVDGGKRRGAKLLLDQDGIRIDGGPEIPWRTATLKRDDADGAILVVGRTATVGSTDEGFLRALESSGGNDIDRQLARIQGLKTGWRGSQSFGCILFFVLIVWGIASVPGCYRSAVDKTVDSLPFEADEELGAAAQESMDVGPEVEDEVVLEALQQMVDRLSAEFEGTDVDEDIVEWQVRVIESDQVNAFALPGGYITVFTALIAEAEDPDMVAGVMAHEMAHVLQRHGLKRVANQIGLFAGLQLIIGDTGGLIGIAGEVLAMAAGNQWSRDQETEADVFGTKAMVRAGLDGQALAEFFALLQDKYGDVPEVLSFMSTHPMHETRIAEINALIEEIGEVEARPLEIDWDDVRERVGADTDED